MQEIAAVRHCSYVAYECGTRNILRWMRERDVCARIVCYIGFMELYFAYGSNLDHEQMAERCPDSVPDCPAVLADHRLDFTTYSWKRGGGAADIVASAGDAVWGAIYSVSESDLESLDRAEGCHAGVYERVRRLVRTMTSETREVWTYSVVRKGGPYEPDAGYLELIREGARKWQLPPEYREMLDSIEAEHHDEDHHGDGSAGCDSHERDSELDGSDD